MSSLRFVIAFCVRNPVFVNLLMWCLVIGGVFATQGMIRESFPQVFLDHVAVEVAYPGASPEDIEQSICIPIEEAVEGIPGVREISSSANENLGTVWLGLRTDVKDVQAIVKEVKDRVDQISTFPEEAKKPIASEKVVRTEVISVAIYGEAPERTLKEIAQEIRDDLTRKAEISQVTLFGARDDEIAIELSEASLQAFDLSLEQVIAMVAKSSLDLPAGVIRTSGEELTLRIVGQKYSAAEYENVVLMEDGGSVVTLSDIATVRDGFADAEIHSRFNGQPAVMVGVFKTPTQDTTTIANVVRQYVEERQASLPPAIRMSSWGDVSTDITGRTSLLVNNGLQGIVLLFLTLAVFLGIKYAFWVAADIPLCFAGALILMYFLDQSINMISLFALIIVAGIVVDDSIVIAESVHAKKKAGLSPELAAIDGTYAVSKPVIAATLTTVIMFVPLMYIEGVMGRFIYPIPVVILAALAASTVDAFCILPSHLHHHEKKAKDGAAIGQTRIRKWIDKRLDNLVVVWFRPLYRKAMDARYVTLALAAGSLLAAGGMVVGGRLPFVLLPKEDGNILRARVRFPEGTPSSVGRQAIEKIEKAALALNNSGELKPAAEGPLVRQVYSIAGQFADFLSIRGSNLCEVRIELMPAEVRVLDDDRIIEVWRRGIGPMADALEYTIARQQLGPTGDPIEIRLHGDDLAQLERASDRIGEELRKFGGVTDVRDDLIPGKGELRVSLLPAARAMGVTVEDVARQLRHAFYGGEAVKLRRGRDEVTVRVRLAEAERASVADLESTLIRTPLGHRVPFSEVATITREQGFAQIMHQDNRRRVRVFADVDERTANAEQILRAVESEFLPTIPRDFQGVAYSFGGERRAVNDSLRGLSNGFIMALIVMYAMLAAMLRSYAQPLVVFLTIPFGGVGAVFGHWLLGYDLTIMSLFGFVALTGITVDHAIIILDGVQEKLREGATLVEAMWSAGESRFNPIILSAITDTAGLLPLMAMTHGQAQSVMPMAIAFSFGLVFSAVVTLFIVPALYLALNDARRFVRWVWRGGAYPNAEQVEDTSMETAVTA